MLYVVSCMLYVVCCVLCVVCCVLCVVCCVRCVVVLCVLLVVCGVVWCCVVLCGVVRLGMRKTPSVCRFKPPSVCTPSIVDTSKFGQKGRLNVRSTAQRENDVCNFKEKSRGRIYPYDGFY